MKRQSFMRCSTSFKCKTVNNKYALSHVMLMHSNRSRDNNLSDCCAELMSTRDYSSKHRGCDVSLCALCMSTKCKSLYLSFRWQEIMYFHHVSHLCTLFHLYVSVLFLYYGLFHSVHSGKGSDKVLL